MKEYISQSLYWLTIESMRIQSHIEGYLIAIIIRNSTGENALLRGWEWVCSSKTNHSRSSEWVIQSPDTNNHIESGRVHGIIRYSDGPHS